jgi:hypothetical protein
MTSVKYFSAADAPSADWARQGEAAKAIADITSAAAAI